MNNYLPVNSDVDGLLLVKLVKKKGGTSCSYSHT